MRIRGAEHTAIAAVELHSLVERSFDGVDAANVEVHVRRARHPGESFTGRAFTPPPRRARALPGTAYLVELVLPASMRNRGYPKTHRYRGLKTAPWITMLDWRERLVALVAHEACHVRQFRLGLRVSEVQAERWALRVLESFRAERACRASSAGRSAAPVQLQLFDAAT